MTAQFRDSIIFKGELFGIANEPFEAFLKTRPDIQYNGFCSACWRGYIAKWEIIEDKLYLIGLNEFKFGKEEPIIKGKSYNFNDIFPDQDKVFAEWFTGDIKIQQGEDLNNRYGYVPIYEKEIILGVEKGVIVNEREVDNRGKVFEEDNEIIIKPNKNESVFARLLRKISKK